MPQLYLNLILRPKASKASGRWTLFATENDVLASFRLLEKGFRFSLLNLFYQLKSLLLADPVFWFFWSFPVHRDYCQAVGDKFPRLLCISMFGPENSLVESDIICFVLITFLQQFITSESNYKNMLDFGDVKHDLLRTMLHHKSDYLIYNYKRKPKSARIVPEILNSMYWHIDAIMSNWTILTLPKLF